MSDAHNQPTPEQLAPLMAKHHATWKWMTGMFGYSLAGILLILALLALFVA